jgi:hypothetical protein
MPAPIATAVAAVPPAAPASPAVSAAPTNGAAKSAAAAPETFLELKVNGQVKKYTRAEAERLVSKAGAADEVFQKSKEALRVANEERARATQSAADRKRYAKERTEDFLREHDIDPDEFARLRLEKKVEDGKLTPDQKRALQAEQEAQRLKDELAKRDQDREAETVKARTTQLQRHIETTLASAAKRAGIEPGDTSFVAIYEALKEAHDLGLLPENGMLEPHQADVIVDEAKGRIDSQMSKLEQAVLGGLTGEGLLKRVGDKVALAVSQAMVARVRGSGSHAAPSQTLVPAPPPPQEPVKRGGYKTEAEIDAELRKMAAVGR